MNLGNYELVSRLGKGGMAEVFKARALEGPRAGQEFALKRLLPELQNDPEYLAMFAGEADVIRFLDHPNIVKVLEVGSDGDTYFLVMELIDGRDGGQIIKRCRERKIPWPIDFAVYLTRVLLEALSYAHDALGPTGKPLGIVHCDVSPSNLFISRTGDIKLGDFGVARGLIDAGVAEVMGKPYYLSPETLGGVISPAADLWAATVTLFELLTAERPFPGSHGGEVRGDPLRAASSRPHRRAAGGEPASSGWRQRCWRPQPGSALRDRGRLRRRARAACDERVGTPLAIAAVVRGLFGNAGSRPALTPIEQPIEYAAERHRPRWSPARTRCGSSCRASAGETPIARRTGEGRIVPEAHAAPTDTANPSRSRAMSSASASRPRKHRLLVFPPWRAAPCTGRPASAASRARNRRAGREPWRLGRPGSRRAASASAAASQRRPRGCRPGSSLLVPRDERLERDPAPHGEEAHPYRPSELVRGVGHRVGLEDRGEPPWPCLHPRSSARRGHARAGQAPRPAAPPRSRCSPPGARRG